MPSTVSVDKDRLSDNVVDFACDMSKAFISGVAEYLLRAEVTVDVVPHRADFYPGAERCLQERTPEEHHPKALW